MTFVWYDDLALVVIVLLAGTLFLLLCIACICTFPRPSQNTQQQLGNTTNALPQLQNERFPTSPFKTSSDTSSVKTVCCVVCLDKYEKDTLVRRLPCGHVFHPECIDTWFENRLKYQYQPSCPSCREFYPICSLNVANSSLVM